MRGTISLNGRRPVVTDAGTAIAVRHGDQAEFELKLLAPQGSLEKLREAPCIVQHARNRGAYHRLETVYYDTAERLLFQRGMSLRVRHSGKNFIQTLKLPPDDGQPLKRRQWEMPVAGITPDLALFPADEVGDVVAALSNDALVPVFATKVRRHARQLDLPDASVEVAFDEGTIEADARQEVLSEIEIELKSGNAGVLFDLGTQLLDAAPLQIGTRSKAERGYALAFDVAPSAAKAELSGITAELAVDDVIALLVGSCWHHLLKNHAVAEQGSDPEGVHQMRVALRRLRTICALFRRDIPSPAFLAVNGEAKWLMRKLGQTRDWDVFAETTITRLVKAVPDIDLGGLRQAVEQRQKSSYGALQDVLADPRCSRFLLSLGQLVERRSWRNEIDSEALAILSQPMPVLADRILERLHRKTLKRGARFRRLDIHAQHNLRINLKKLRYAAEFFLPLYAAHAPAKRYVKRLAGLQSSLGRVCDIGSTRVLLQTIRQDDQPELHLGIGAMAGWLARDQIAMAKTLRKSWRRFKTAPAFWGR
ncbi:MAG: inorganic triphosphatase [Bradyrhizobium sp. PARBB1]|jgi:triphosphatase|nr:MAG: inorganic triphosphatase [Bradyrhizobium sp. PARBB1]PSO27710.1 inorganic triphosphatase [Bradyrhizobium sp. MOS004]HAQ79345.1 CHAD domain-containing protein [Bradyrhizobium sp.]HAR15303.1 CHAD domain-containing protein [Bradyrhizobium sp.]HAR23116.1 CHAD domain-containing protein [Bradyrhizobium sp.]